MLIKSGILSFGDVGLNVQANPLPKHGESYINMVAWYPSEYVVHDVHFVITPLEDVHARLC